MCAGIYATGHCGRLLSNEQKRLLVENARKKEELELALQALREGPGCVLAMHVVWCMLYVVLPAKEPELVSVRRLAGALRRLAGALCRLAGALRAL